MQASLRALLGGVIDYAGLFPPARLPLATAIGNYVRYRGEPEAWMLARFICPAERLSELGSHVRERFTSDSPLLLAALGRGGDAPEVFLDNLRADLEEIADFVERHGSAVAVENFETRLPVSILSAGPEKLERFLRAAADALASHATPAPTCFYEIPKDADWRGVAKTVATLNQGDAADERRQPNLGGRSRAGLKLRCGGLDAAAIPTTAQVATAIAACRDANVMLKFTAGLHHPVRRVDSALGVPVHGFLNLLAAGVLGAARGLEHHDLLAIIEERDARPFVFSDHSLRWDQAQATVKEITDARRQHVISFGSCSFDEPRDGLRELGYL